MELDTDMDWTKVPLSPQASGSARRHSNPKGSGGSTSRHAGSETLFTVVALQDARVAVPPQPFPGLEVRPGGRAPPGPS
jgi:hypothetical protein